LPNARAQPVARPNVLVLVTDDQRANTYATMPRTVAKLRAEGTEFSNAVAVTPTCCPSRATIMSGQYPHNHGTFFSSPQSAELYDKGDSLQADLHAAGYFTAMVGKYFNGIRTNPPHFDRWATSPSIGYFNSLWNVNGVETTSTGYATTFARNRSLEYLSEFDATDDGKPWYAYIGFKAPHEPSKPEAAFANATFPPWRNDPANTESDLSDKPQYVRDNAVTLEHSKSLRRGMFRTLYSVDNAIMSIFDRLSALGEMDNTLVFLLSDHGFMWWEHKLSAKHAPYDPSVRIPMFVRWPGHFAAGAKRTEVVATLDVAPTVYAATGIIPEHVMDGKPLGSSNRARIFLEFYAGSRVPSWNALWSPTETYVRYASEREYYAPDDPWQLTNRYKDGIPGNEPTQQAEWDRWLANQKACTGALCE
jgi:arylsulfatase A-like enzyme